MGCINRNDIEGLRTHLKNGVDPNFGPADVDYKASQMIFHLCLLPLKRGGPKLCNCYWIIKQTPNAH